MDLESENSTQILVIVCHFLLTDLKFQNCGCKNVSMELQSRFISIAFFMSNVDGCNEVAAL